MPERDQGQNRPSHEELSTRIRLAEEAVRSQEIIPIIEPLFFAADASELGYAVKEELKEVVGTILSEIRPEHYVGPWPAPRSDEEKIRGCELFQFRYFCGRLGSEVYFKFALGKSGMF